MTPLCIGCKKTPGELAEYVDAARDEQVTPDQFVIENEGTYNTENGHFLCTTCYIAEGMPSSAAGWRAP